MIKKVSLIWWIIGGWVFGFIFSILIQLIYPTHTFSWVFVIYHSFLSMSILEIGGILYSVTDESHRMYHGGCHYCTKRKKSYCKGCCYYHKENEYCNWNLPDLNDHKY